MTWKLKSLLWTIPQCTHISIHFHFSLQLLLFKPTSQCHISAKSLPHVQPWHFITQYNHRKKLTNDFSEFSCSNVMEYTDYIISRILFITSFFLFCKPGRSGMQSGIPDPPKISYQQNSHSKQRGIPEPARPYFAGPCGKNCASYSMPCAWPMLSS